MPDKNNKLNEVGESISKSGKSLRDAGREFGKGCCNPIVSLVKVTVQVGAEVVGGTMEATGELVKSVSN